MKKPTTPEGMTGPHASNDNKIAKGLPVVVAQNWLIDLARLLDRYHHLQITPDVAQMSLGDLRGVYQRLLRMEADEKEADQ